jgi:hypothetical protein
MRYSKDLESKIQQRAYEIWEGEGKPHGRDILHWLRAEAECCAVTQIGSRKGEPNANGTLRGRNPRVLTPLARPKSGIRNKRAPSHNAARP